MAGSIKPRGPVPPSAVLGDGAGGLASQEEQQEAPVEPQLSQEEIAQLNEEQRLIIGLKLGATLIKWIPWPHCPEEKWVPMRTLTIPELDSAYLFALQKCAELKRPNDEVLFERWQQIAQMSHALRDGLATQTGYNDDGPVLKITREKYDAPLFTTPNHLRESLRDKAALNEILGYYWEHSLSAAPLSTYKRLAREGEFVDLVKVLKKKPGPIDLEGFSPTDLEAFISFLVKSFPLGQAHGTQG